jgi:hypothetical protein
MQSYYILSPGTSIRRIEQRIKKTVLTHTRRVLAQNARRFGPKRIAFWVKTEPVLGQNGTIKIFALFSGSK